MFTLLHLFTAILLTIVHCAPLANSLMYEHSLMYEWTTMEFEWPSDEVKFNFTKDGRYIQNNNALAGIKLWRDEVYVTVPRWRPGVPITLGKVVLDSDTVRTFVVVVVVVVVVAVGISDLFLIFYLFFFLLNRTLQLFKPTHHLSIKH